MSSQEETPAFFRAGSDRLFGVLTRPSGEARGTAVVVAAAGGYHTSIHLNRLSVSLCRQVAREGYHGLRFDYHGVGESTGDLAAYRFAEPFVDDLAGALAWARREGAERFVPVGLCFGARTAISVAREDHSVAGLILVSLPMHDLRQGEGTPARRAEAMSVWSFVRTGLRPQVLRRFFPPYRFRRQLRVARAHIRVGVRAVLGRLKRGVRLAPPDAAMSPGLMSDLEDLLARRIPILFVFGGSDPFYRQYLRAAEGPLAAALREAGSAVQVVTVPGTTRPYESVEGQARLIEAVEVWLAQNASAPRGLSRRAAAAPMP